MIGPDFPDADHGVTGPLRVCKLNEWDAKRCNFQLSFHTAAPTASHQTNHQKNIAERPFVIPPGKHKPHRYI